MKFKLLMIGLLILGQGTTWANSNDECTLVREECEAVITAFEETVNAQDLQIEKYGELIKDQDLVISNLRKQRDAAIEGGGEGLLDVLPWALIGAAATTVIIGIRR